MPRIKGYVEEGWVILVIPAEVILDQLTSRYPQMYKVSLDTITNKHSFSDLKEHNFIVTDLEVRSLKWVHRAAFLLEAIGENLIPCLL